MKEGSRTKASSIPGRVVRGVFVTASCVVTGCAVLGFALSCHLLLLLDPAAAPCPARLTIATFAAGGGLLLLGLIMLLVVCSRRRKEVEALEDLPVTQEGPMYLKKSSGNPPEGLQAEKEPESPGVEEREEFELTQKSADVSYWIEQQKPTESGDSFCLDPVEGNSGRDQPSDNASDGEMTAL